MSQVERFALVMLVLTIVPWPGAAQGEEIRWQRDATAAYESARQQGRPLLMYVTMPGCHFCTKMKLATWSDDRVAERVNEQFVPVAIDTSRYGEYVRKLRIRAYPTTLVISTDGKVVQRINGYVSPAELRQRLDTVTVPVSM